MGTRNINKNPRIKGRQNRKPLIALRCEKLRPRRFFIYAAPFSQNRYPMAGTEKPSPW